MEPTEEQIIEALDKWNFWNNEIDTGIERKHYLDKLKLYLETDEIIAVQGGRRTGKSTILLQLLEYLIKKKNVNKLNTLYVNLEDESFFPYLSVEFLKKIVDSYRNIIGPKGRVFAVFDEIQKITGWEHFVRSLYDRKENIKIFITGSSSKLLSSEFSTLLTGRHLSLEVYPLSFEEYLKFRSIKVKNKLDLISRKNQLISLSKQYLVEGGYPKAVLTKNPALKKELLNTYFNNIIAKDVAERYNIRDIAKIKNIAIYYATNFCGFISFNSLKKALNENSVETIDHYSQYLESSYLISFNKIFDFSLKKQMANERKVYIIDNGLRNSVAFTFKDMYGNLLENSVYYELKRANQEIFYYKGKREVDFVIKKGLKVVNVINVCFSLKESKEREINSLLEAMEKFNLRESTIVTFDEEERIKLKGYTINAVPFYKFVLNSPLKLK